MTTEPTPLVTVLPCEADKEAAHHFNLYITNGCINGVEEAELASLFAKRAHEARLAALEEAAAKCLEVSAWIGAGAGSSIDSALQEAATAIRALSNKGGEGSGGGADTRAKCDTSFLQEIMDRSPNGEPVMVQYHPNGDWTVFDRKSNVTDEQRREYARSVEGDSDNPMRVREANLILEGRCDADVERFAASNKGGRDGE